MLEPYIPVYTLGMNGCIEYGAEERCITDIDFGRLSVVVVLLPTYLGNRLPVFAGLVNAPFHDPGWRTILLISVIH